MPDNTTGPAARYPLVAGLPWEAANLLDAPLFRVVYDEEPGVDVEVEVATTDARGREEGLKDLAAVVGEPDAQSLLDVEDRLFSWLAEHPDHPAQFLTDPISCLQRIETALSDAGWHALTSHRLRQLRTFDGTPLAAVKTLKVRVAAARGRVPGEG